MNIDPTILTELRNYLHAERSSASKVLHRLAALGQELVPRGSLVEAWQSLLEEDPELASTPLAPVLHKAQVAVVQGSWLCFALRRRIGRWAFLRLHLETHDVAEVGVRDFLRLKERLSGEPDQGPSFPLEIDLAPFEQGLPKLQEAGSIGGGAQYLNRRLAGRLFRDLESGADSLLGFLRAHGAEASERLDLQVEPEVACLFAAVQESLRAAIRRETPWRPSDSEVFDCLLACAVRAWTARAPGARRPDPVIERDGYRCAVPGCTSRSNLHDHHIVFRSAGGGHWEWNRVTLCAFHHQRGVHRGELIVCGRAPDALVFELGVRPDKPPLARFVSGDVLVA